MKRRQDGSIDYCLDCINKMTIRCAWCGEPIFIGSPITLYTPKKQFEIPEYAVTYSISPRRLVGCLSWDCAMTGGDRSGFWLPDEKKQGAGHVFRVPSLIEKLLNKEGLEVIIVDDLGSIAEATR